MPENDTAPRSPAAPGTTRRTLLLAAGSTGIAALTGACADPGQALGSAGQPQCVLIPEAGAGPYYVDLDRVRSDVTEGREGVPLRLELTVVRVSAGCRPLKGAAVDIWHADSAGEYSTGGETYLRGTQVTDAAGRCAFRTIVPGWYAGLAPHIHFKVHPRPDSRQETVSQFFFPEELLRKVYAREPYSRRRAPKNPNGRDDRFRATGTAMTLNLTPNGAGYRAAYTVGIA